MLPGLHGPGRANGAGWLSRILATLATCALLVVGVMFSVAMLAIAAVTGVLVLIWIWWKLRRVRKMMRQARHGESPGQEGSPSDSRDRSVIDGEVIKGEWKDDQR